MANASFDPIPLIGPLFIANSLNWMGLGFLLVQLYHYFDNFPVDKIKIRVFVWTLLLLELFQSASSTYHTWAWSITDWCANAEMTVHPWTAPVIPLMDGVLGWVVQMFYAWRIWVLAPNVTMKVFSVIVVLLSTAYCVAASVPSIIFFTNLTSAELAKLGDAFTAWAPISFVADGFIAVGMIIVLRSGRNEILWSKTDNIIKRLIIMTISTGSLLAVVSMVTTVLFVTAEGRASFPYDVGAYTLGKLYSNSAMVTLNARKGFRRTLLETTGKHPTVSLQFRSSNPHRRDFEATDLSSHTTHTTGDHSSVALDTLKPVDELVSPPNQAAIV